MNFELDTEFTESRQEQIEAMGSDGDLHRLSSQWFQLATSHGYSYHFDALGRPIIQFPQDIIAVNELIWSVRPDLVIETGIARGGSIVNTASQLALLDLSESPRGAALLPRRKVVGIDIDIRAGNRGQLEKHFLAPWFELVEGSSTSADVVELVTSRITHDAVVLVLLDSNHTHDHVLAELRAYGPLVSPGSYCVVFDTVIEYLPAGYFDDRPWDVGNNPATAVQEFMRDNADFVVDEAITNKLLVSVAPGGYLRRVHDSSA